MADEIRVTDEVIGVDVTRTKLRCEFCDYEFLDASKLFQHESSHNPTNGFECNTCRINVMSLKGILFHWSTECPYELYETERHINVKTLYACNVCENKFSTLDELYEHR